MNELIIELSPELQRRLALEAARRGVSVDQCARFALEMGLSLTNEMPEGPTDLGRLARRQGAPLAVPFEDLLGDFWPEDESADDFILAIRDWRRQDSPPVP